MTLVFRLIGVAVVTLCLLVACNNYRPYEAKIDYGLDEIQDAIPPEETRQEQYVLSEEDVNCLAANIYHEARGEDEVGQALVAQVVFNRVQYKQYPSTVCANVFKPYQFSWTLSNTKMRVLPNKLKGAYMDLIYRFNTGEIALPPKLAKATHYWNPDLCKHKPYWTAKFEYLGKWKNHHFYFDPSLNESLKYTQNTKSRTSVSS